MKYVVTWTVPVGRSAQQREADLARSLKVFSKWTPTGDVIFHELLARVDGNGGFAVVEADNAASLAADVEKWVPFHDFQVFPVLEIQEALALAQQAMEFRNSVQ
jgi:hypothetical protein